MNGLIIPTPKRDASMFNNELRGYERQTPARLKNQAECISSIEVTRAKDKAAQYELSILTGRIDLMNLRSDDVEVFIEYLKVFVSDLIAAEKTYTVPVFALYEKRTETTVVNDVRDITFNATLLENATHTE